MPVFTYTGRSRRGEFASGLIEGESRDSVASRLFGNGITPIEIKPAASKEDGELARWLRKIGFGAPTIGDLVLFSRQMYTITKSGIPLLRGIRGLAASTNNAVLREALEDVLSNLEGGRDLAGSFARHPNIFPTLYISIIKVGEQTGTLEASFKRLAEYLAQDQDVRDRIKAATRYPIIVLVTIAIAVAVLTIFVIPKFAPLFRALGDNIPLPTRLLMGTSTFVQHYWHVVLIGIAVANIAARQYVNTVAGRMRWDKWKLKIPAIGPVIYEGILARVTRSLAIALSAGMPVIQTLRVIGQSAGNEYMAEKVGRMRDAVERGEPVSRAGASVQMFTPLVIQMMSVGEETGNLSELLDEVADFYEREVDFKLKGLSSAIEPILVVVVGAIVCVLALGVMLPMWDMISKVGSGAGM
jgi:MSHA biogenesis protein MshG